MKKFLKLFVVAALSAGMLISAVAISGCSDTPLISGDFSKEATSEQLDELDAYIGSSDSVYGDTAAEDWEYNARMLTRGDTDISVVQNATILNVVLNSTTNIKADYDSEQTLSFRNSENGPVLRGSGAVDYSYNLTETSGEDTEVQSINLSGYSYNDNDYFYLDGAASLNIGENSFSQTAKFKMPLEGAFSEIFLADQGPEGDEVFDFTMLAQLITQDGVEVYIDAQTTFKVKISLDVNAWLNSNAALKNGGRKMNTIGQRIAYYRKKANLTQEELAEKCSVTPQAVSKWENDISAPDISLFPVLAKLFNTTCDELLGAETETPKVVPEELVDLSKVLLKIRVISADGDNVKLNLPISIAEQFLSKANIGGNEALKSIDFAQIMQLVMSGATGKLVEITSADGDTVTISVE